MPLEHRAWLLSILLPSACAAALACGDDASEASERDAMSDAGNESTVDAATGLPFPPPPRPTVALPGNPTTGIDPSMLPIFIQGVFSSTPPVVDRFMQTISLVSWPEALPVPLGDIQRGGGRSPGDVTIYPLRGAQLAPGWYKLSASLTDQFAWPVTASFSIDGERASALLHVGSLVLLQSVLLCPSNIGGQKLIVAMSEPVTFGSECAGHGCITLQNELGQAIACKVNSRYDEASFGFVCALRGDESALEFEYLPGFIQSGSDGSNATSLTTKISMPVSDFELRLDGCRYFRVPVETI